MPSLKQRILAEEFGNTIKKAKKNEKTELGKVCKAQRSKAIPPPRDDGT